MVCEVYILKNENYVSSLICELEPIGDFEHSVCS